MDEIGIGLVRDAFANLFFPGTSTVQTVAKYFLIVPYVLKEATEGRYGNDLNKILRKIDLEEKECGIRLMRHCPGEEGIIGRRVLPKSWVARKPSNIYWNGIRTYGICTQNLTIPELLKASIILQAQKKTSSLGNKGDDATDSERDDADAGREVATQLFSVPADYYRDWRTDLSIHLTATEAAFLRKMIGTSVSESLLGYLLRNNIDVTKYDSFEAIYLLRNGQNRVLVADEVGMGKTLIARGATVKTARMRLEQQDELMKVVYICSNTSIANQNIQKLKVSDSARIEGVSDTRLSMLHLKIAEQESDEALREGYIQLIPLTPGTSFQMIHGGGTYNERSLMFAILSRIPEMETYIEAMERFLVYGADGAWYSWARDWYEEKVSACQKKTQGKYSASVISSIYEYDRERPILAKLI